MDVTTQTLPVARGPYKLHAEVVPGTGAPIVLMHGFPDNTHLYDRLVPHLAGRRPVVRFDFLGWGRSDKPQGYPYTSANQVGDLAAVISAVDEHVGDGELVLVAHDASGLPAIDWALANPDRRESWCCSAPTTTGPGPAAPARHRLVLNAGHPHRCPRPCPAAAGPGPAAVRLAGRRVHPGPRGPRAARSAAVRAVPARPAFWRLNDDLLGAVFTRRRRIPELRRFARPVQIIFGSRDRSLNPGSLATSPRCSPAASCICSTTPGICPSRPAAAGRRPDRRRIDRNQ
jgi:haloalkane dehalogenase